MKKIKTNFLLHNRYFFALILILFFVFWIWWLPGSRVANDFSFIAQDFLKLQFDIPRAWNERGAEGLGEYGIFILWSYPINFIFGILAALGLNFELWERILVLLFIFLGSFSIWKFLSAYRLSDQAKFIGALFYLVNTYSILLVDGGQISIALAYGLFPLAILFAFQAAYERIKKKILAGLMITILGFFDIRFVYILFLFFLLRSLFDILEHRRTRLKTFWEWLNTGVIMGLIVLALNSFWLIAYLKNPINNEVFISFTKISTNFLNIGHTLLVIAPHWYKNVFGKIAELQPEFILLPILVFLAPIFRRRDKSVLFWLFVAIVSIFLAKGGSEPLPSVYPFLHSNIPGFAFFRDSTKFFFLLTLSYSVLISITSEEITKRFLIKKRLEVFYLLFMVIYLLYLIKPVLLSQMTGTFSIQPAEKEFQSLSDVLQNDKEFGRVFWIPATAPLSYSDLNHPIVEAAREFSRKPFVYGVKGTYETFNFLREAPYMGEIFDVAAISYLAYPLLDSRRDNLHPDNIKYYYTFLNQLSSLPWIEKSVPESKVPLLKLKSHQDKIFMTKNTWIVFGSDEVFNEVTKSAKLKLSNNAIIFMEDQPGRGQLINRYPEVKIVLNNKTGSDITASFIPASQIIFPANQLNVSPNKSGWWKNDGTDLISWRDFLQTKYGIDNKDFDLGGGWAVGEGNRQLIIDPPVGRADNAQLTSGKTLFARVMESSRGGTLKFYQANQTIGEVSTKLTGKVNVRWFEVGKLNTNIKELSIKSEGDINIINALAIVDPNDLSNYEQKAKDLSKRIAEFLPENVDGTISKISYKKINQTKYKVLVSSLTSPSLIVFSSTFHPGWKLDGKSSIPVYGFLNGFRVDSDGEYTLEFEPQRYLEFGLIVSSFSLIFLISFLMISRKESHA